MCHRGADANMSLCFRPYLTIPTKIRPLTGLTPADTGRDGGGAGREEWQHWCIIHLFIIPHYSPLIIPSPQKPVCPLFFCLCKCHLSERDWNGEEDKGHIFSLNFDFLHLCQYCVLHFFLIGPNEHIAHTVRGQQVWSCTALPHRVTLCVSKKSVGSMGNVLGGQPSGGANLLSRTPDLFKLLPILTLPLPSFGSCRLMTKCPGWGSRVTWREVADCVALSTPPRRRYLLLDSGAVTVTI